MKLKDTGTGTLTAAHPDAEVGLQNGVYTYEITGIPAGTPAAEVVRLANGTTFLPARHDGTGRFAYRFAELWIGRIIKPEVALTDIEINNARYSKDEKVNQTSVKLAESEKASRAGNHDQAARAFLEALL